MKFSHRQLAGIATPKPAEPAQSDALRSLMSACDMSSEDAMNAGSADRYGQADKYNEPARCGGEGKPQTNSVSEGVEGLVPDRGSLGEFTCQFVGGRRSAMG